MEQNFFNGTIWNESRIIYLPNFGEKNAIGNYRFASTSERFPNIFEKEVSKRKLFF